MRKNEATVYLGKLANEYGQLEHVYVTASMALDSHEQRHRPADYLLTLTDHTTMSADAMVTLSLSGATYYEEARIPTDRKTPPTSENYAISFGRVKGAEYTDAATGALRRRDANGSALTDDDVLFIFKTWDANNLNTMNAACDHMTPEMLTPPADAYVPLQYGKPDITGWRIKNVVCPVTGYKWGGAWLAKAVPAETLTRVAKTFGIVVPNPVNA